MNPNYSKARKLNYGLIMIQKIEPEEKTESGIIIPVQGTEVHILDHYYKGIIVKKGEKYPQPELATKEPQEEFCSVGDTIICSHAYIRDWEEKDDQGIVRKYAIIGENNIVAIL